jgi:hypothetical protein
MRAIIPDAAAAPPATAPANGKAPTGRKRGRPPKNRPSAPPA